ncbi:DUF2971 domain-containing protein [Aeromonas hydrophila]|uniref:DUF2971 domain-containing protein n=1 Tax=Aeromonas hydrophila TaxID=644 RepID=UPI001A910B45|nr:DUF2971 domain-containing protein [Aeromonas hydrophila]MBO0405530.1 DUF2971 domain-containing protein [Aeromonas hydrophila]
MDILYKYSGLLPYNYFDNPTIKLSVPEHLNDPFEYNTSKNIVLALKNNFLKIDMPEDKANEYAEGYETSIINMISFNGIVSFTETPRNSLMWAHYASHHNGMCIGYKRKVLEHITPKKEDYIDITVSSPTKINYDNLRFSSDYEFIDLANADRDAVIGHLLKKSDEWIYEKEHRCIIPYKNTSKIMFKTKDLEKSTSIVKGGDRRNLAESAVCIKEWIDELTNEEIIEIVEIGYMSTYRLLPHKDKNKVVYTENALQLLTNYKELSFLIDIEIENIESVYFGCKVNKDVVKEFFDRIDKRIKLYHFSICEERFELKPVKIDDEYFK